MSLTSPTLPSPVTLEEHNVLVLSDFGLTCLPHSQTGVGFSQTLHPGLLITDKQKLTFLLLNLLIKFFADQLLTAKRPVYIQNEPSQPLELAKRFCVEAIDFSSCLRFPCDQSKG